MKLLISLRYDGAGFCGYQVQPNRRTVQAALNSAAEALFGFPCDITGCSRTDSGVHAEQFCATVARHGTASIETGVPVDKIPVALNRFLPADVAVFAAQWVSDAFHARYDVREKEYRYLIHNAPARNPFLCGRALHYPRPVTEEQLAAMRKAAGRLVGTHDFAAMMAQGSPVESTVRTVTRAEVERDGELIVFRVAADGFLYHMVRIMTGTLLAAAEGRLLPDDMEKILASRDRAQAGATAPACGLYLAKVTYRSECV